MTKKDFNKEQQQIMRTVEKCLKNFDELRSKYNFDNIEEGGKFMSASLHALGFIKYSVLKAFDKAPESIVMEIYTQADESVKKRFSTPEKETLQ